MSEILETSSIIAGMLLAAVVLCSPVACTMHRESLVRDAIARGGDPIGVKCAIDSDAGREPVCIAYATRAR